MKKKNKNQKVKKEIQTKQSNNIHKIWNHNHYKNHMFVNKIKSKEINKIISSNKEENLKNNQQKQNNQKINQQNNR